MRDNQRQLEVLVEQARNDLLRIGKSLIDDSCIEVWNLLDEIDALPKNSAIEEFGIAFGGFCSQSGRLAGVMASMSKIGDRACEAADSRKSRSNQKSSDVSQLMQTFTERPDTDQQLRLELQVYVHELGQLGSDLQRLCEVDLSFIVCDARVLHDHPEVVRADVIRKLIAAATDRIDAISESLWNLAEDAKKKASSYEATLIAHSAPYKIN